MSEPLVHISDFRMVFGNATVIEDLSFDVAAGETFGFLGSNGSGKTTTLRALLGIYQPTAGTLHIGGEPFDPATGAGQLGYLPEERGLYKKEPVLATMTYFGRLKGMGKAAARSWSLDYLERVGLADKAQARLDKLSGGQQQKVQLGVTIMNTPELLILDEPTKGFDPINRRLLMDIIEEQRRSGVTVVMVTHQMEEVQRLCERVILLKDGTSRAYGTVREVQEQFGGTTYRVTHTGRIPASPHFTVVDTHPMGQEQVSELAPVTGGPAANAPATGAGQAAVLSELVGAGVGVSDFTAVRTSLEEVFLKVYGTRADEQPETTGTGGRTG